MKSPRSVSAVHELAIAQHLAQVVESHAREAEADRVVAVDLKLGSQSHVDDDSLRFHFDLLTQDNGSLCEGAEIRVRRVPMRLRCASCGTDYTPEGADYRCPDCNGLGELQDVGDEITLEAIEVEP